MKKIVEGSDVPYINVPVMHNGEWTTLDTKSIFSGRTVVVFSLPGAFTPTCSSYQLPRYNELFDIFKDHGVDEIMVVSVNDTFTMNAWAKDQNVENITFFPDGNGDFTRGMGMLVDKKDLGFGERSWRYSMLVKDGRVVKSFVEPDEPGDPYYVSDADTMLGYIAPEVKPESSVMAFTKPGCTYCHKAKQLLLDSKIKFEEIILGQDATMTSLKAVSGSVKVPQVFIDGMRIGGSDELEKYLSDK